MRTLEEHAQALADGHTSSRALVEQCLARIADPNGEGPRAFIKVHTEQARAMADAMDTLRAALGASGAAVGDTVSAPMGAAGTLDGVGASALADAVRGLKVA